MKKPLFVEKLYFPRFTNKSLASLLTSQRAEPFLNALALIDEALFDEERQRLRLDDECRHLS